MSDHTQAQMVHPLNGILLDSIGLHTQTMKVGSHAHGYPGTLVEHGTNDDDTKTATLGGAVIGFYGYEHCHKKYRPEDINHHYKFGAQAPIHWGPGVIYLGVLASGETVVKGDRLISAGGGELALASAAALPAGTTAVKAAAEGPTVVGPIPAEGIVVAIAEESVDNSNGARRCRILVRSLI